VASAKLPHSLRSVTFFRARNLLLGLVSRNVYRNVIPVEFSHLSGPPARALKRAEE